MPGPGKEGVGCGPGAERSVGLQARDPGERAQDDSGEDGRANSVESRLTCGLF